MGRIYSLLTGCVNFAAAWRVQHMKAHLEKQRIHAYVQILNQIAAMVCLMFMQPQEVPFTMGPSRAFSFQAYVVIFHDFAISDALVMHLLNLELFIFTLLALCVGEGSVFAQQGMAYVVNQCAQFAIIGLAIPLAITWALSRKGGLLHVA